MKYLDFGDDQLRFLTEPRIFPGSESRRDNFYISGIAIADDNEKPYHFCLYTSGRWGIGTFDGETHAGYFAKETDAETALRKANIQRHPCFDNKLTPERVQQNARMGFYRPT